VAICDPRDFILNKLDILVLKKFQVKPRKDPKYREPQHINWNQNFKRLMDSVEGYARKWAKQEKVELDSF